jgi:hypothetical protein
MNEWTKRLAAVSTYFDLQGTTPKPTSSEPDPAGANKIESKKSSYEPLNGVGGSSYLKSYSIGNRELLLVAIFLALICLLTHYLRLGSYGLYEDDYAVISPAFTLSWDNLVDTIKSFAQSWPQGRPVGWSWSTSSAFLAQHLGGLHVLYILEYLIVSVNAFLCYLVLRSQLPVAYAAVGAVVFCAYPADTSQLFAVAPVFQHLAVMAFLLGAIAYARRRWVLCYCLAAAPFLAYESICVPFLALPLLFRDRSRSWLAQLASHLLVLYSGIVTALFIRASLGEGRIQELHGQLGATVGKAFWSMAVGPLVVLHVAILRPLEVLQHMDGGLLLVLVAAAALIVAYWRLLPTGPTERGTVAVPFRFKFLGLTGGIEVAKPLPQIASICGLGLVFWVLPYSLAFRDPYFLPNGRLSVVHLAGSFGGAMLAGGLTWLFVFVAEGYGKRTIALFIVALYLGSLVSFHNIVQRQFGQAWQTERRFWSAVVRSCPDLEDGTIILHELASNSASYPGPGTYVLPNAWSDAIVLTQLFEFPSTWHLPPRLISVPLNWKDSVQQDSVGLKWLVPAAGRPEHWEPLDVSKLIVLEQTGPGTFTRLNGTIRIAGKDYPLKPTGVAANFLPTKPLFQYLCR